MWWLSHWAGGKKDWNGRPVGRPEPCVTCLSDGTVAGRCRFPTGTNMQNGMALLTMDITIMTLGGFCPTACDDNTCVWWHFLLLWRSMEMTTSLLFVGAGHCDHSWDIFNVFYHSLKMELLLLLLLTGGMSTKSPDKMQRRSFWIREMENTHRKMVPSWCGQVKVHQEISPSLSSKAKLSEKVVQGIQCRCCYF